MARTDNLNNFLTDIGNAIRTKENSSELIPASEYDTRIINLPSGGGEGGVQINGTEYTGTAMEDLTAGDFITTDNFLISNVDGSTGAKVVSNSIEIADNIILSIYNASTTSINYGVCQFNDNNSTYVLVDAQNLHTITDDTFLPITEAPTVRLISSDKVLIAKGTASTSTTNPNQMLLIYCKINADYTLSILETKFTTFATSTTMSNTHILQLSKNNFTKYMIATSLKYYFFVELSDTAITIVSADLLDISTIVTTYTSYGDWLEFDNNRVIFSCFVQSGTSFYYPNIKVMKVADDYTVSQERTNNTSISGYSYWRESLICEWINESYLMVFVVGQASNNIQHRISVIQYTYDEGADTYTSTEVYNSNEHYTTMKSYKYHIRLTHLASENAVYRVAFGSTSGTSTVTSVIMYKYRFDPDDNSVKSNSTSVTGKTNTPMLINSYQLLALKNKKILSISGASNGAYSYARAVESYGAPYVSSYGTKISGVALTTANEGGTIKIVTPS